MATREERAWAAGFFDGEGNVWAGARKSNRNSGKYKARAIVVQIAQVDPKVLRRFRKIVGLGSVNGPYSTTNGQPAYRWSTAGLPSAKVIWRLLYPWLSPVKRKQFEDALNRYDALESKKSRGLS